MCSAYTGSSKTVTLKYDPAVFTMAATDKVYILAENALKSTNANRQLTVSTSGNANSNLEAMNNVAQSALDLKDFADEGYSPATNKVQGVVLVDACTANSDMVGTDSAALASVCTEGRLAELDAGNLPTDIAAIPTTMVGTDNAALASVLGAAVGASISADIAAVKAETVLILADTGTDGVKLNATQPAGWAANLVASASTITKGTVDNTAFTATTTILEADDITTAAADHWIGRLIIFTSGTLIGQMTNITDYALTSGRGRFTYTATTSAPANDVTFVIV